MKRDDVVDGDGGRVCERQQTSLVSLEDDLDEESKHVPQVRTAGQRKAEDASAEGRRPFHGGQKSPPPARASASSRDRRRICRRQKTRSSRTEDALIEDRRLGYGRRMGRSPSTDERFDGDSRRRR
jgi:hypothetical protein